MAEVLKLQRGVLGLSHQKRSFRYVLSVAMKSNEIDNPGSDQQPVSTVQIQARYRYSLFITKPLQGGGGNSGGENNG